MAQARQATTASAIVMTKIIRHVRLGCPSCQSADDCTISEMVGRLRKAGVLKASSDSPPEVIRELFLAAATRLRCDRCGAVGLVAQEPDDADNEAWGQARACERCRAPIPAERIELIPDARLCVACQRQADAGSFDDDREFCPRCGAVMELAARRGPGVTRLERRCPACRSTVS